MIKKSLEQLFEAMYHGKYDFSDFIEGEIVSNFEMFEIHGRKIYKPNIKLKKYHDFLTLFIFENFRINLQAVYSYRKGVNVYDAVSKHAKSKYFFQTDIVNFFNSIDVDIVRKIFLDNLDVMPVGDAEAYMERIFDLVTVDGMLPVGFSTSPIISNACLFEFDEILYKYCEENNIVYTRYADDIIISSVDKDGLVGIFDFVERILFDTFDGKFKLHQGKTKFTHIGLKVKLLGMVILQNGTISVDAKLKNKIEVMLYFYVSDRAKFLELAESDFSTEMAKMSGYLGYVNTIDKNYLNKLRKKYGATVVDIFLHYSPGK